MRSAARRSTSRKAEIRPGVNGGDVHRLVSEFFAEHGFPTLLTKKEGEVLQDGFYHGLGHGVGLEVHEAPALGLIGDELVAGDVITIEPGLYRQGFGGVRRRGPPARHRGRLRAPDRLPLRPGRRRVSDKAIETLFARGAALPAARGVRCAGERAGRTSTTFPSRSSGSARAASGSPGSSRSRRSRVGARPTRSGICGGKLNVAYNCLDRHVEAGLGDRVAYLLGGRAGRRARGDHLRATCCDGSCRWRTSSRSSASARAPRSRSTSGWSPSCRSRCSRARGSARRTRWSSAASPPSRSRTGERHAAARC